jgi:hypothetical protein
VDRFFVSGDFFGTLVMGNAAIQAAERARDLIGDCYIRGANASSRRERHGIGGSNPGASTLATSD